MKRLALAAVLLAAACGSRREELNYKRCLKLRVGMPREELLKAMGKPDETIPFVEGKSLEYLRGRTAYEWANPPSMPGPDHVSVEEATGQVASIRCASAEITAPVFVEPPARAAVATSTAAPRGR